MNQLRRPIDHILWRDDFFPPPTAWRNLARAAAMLALFLLWVTLSGLIAIGLIRLGFSLEAAGFMGVLTPPGVLIALNIAGVFNRRRGDLKNLKTFRKWLAGAAGQRHGLLLAHVAAVQPFGSNGLRLTVTADWMRQPSDKWLTDLNYWYVLWNWCRDDGAERAALELIVIDQAGQQLGGSNQDDGGAVWVFTQL